MKTLLWILLTATLLLVNYLSFLYIPGKEKEITIQGDSTSYYHKRYDSVAVLNERLYTEMNREIKYWKDSAFFYCGKYYEQMRIRDNHINNVQTLIQQ